MNAPIAVADDPDRIDPAIWKIAVVALMGAFVAQLDATVVNVSLSTLAADLHTSLSTIQWVTSGYLLALALMIPLNGWLVDRIGAKALYISCLASFTLSSVLCGVAWSAGSLIGFRILQGMSGGLLAPMTQLMFARAAGKRFARVAGYAAVPILLAPLLGPAIAGAILTFASWRWLFLINLPAGLLAVAMAFVFLPSDRDETEPRTLDFAGLALLSPGLVLFLYGIDHLGEPLGYATCGASLVMLTLFYVTARKKGDAALIDLRLLTGRTFSASAISMFLMSGVAFAGQMLVPVYLIKDCGLSPSDAGWLMAPLGLGMMCTYPLMGKLTDRFGIQRVAAFGALLAFVGMLPFLYLANYGFNQIVLIAALYVRGVGMSAIGIPSISAAYASVARNELPMATSAMNIIQRLGAPVLTTMVASFLGWRLAALQESNQASAFTATFVLLCALHFVLILAALRLPLKIERTT